MQQRVCRNRRESTPLPDKYSTTRSMSSQAAFCMGVAVRRFSRDRGKPSLGGQAWQIQEFIEAGGDDSAVGAGAVVVEDR